METTCPICGNEKRMRKAKLLYGIPTCRKCYYKFANLRQVAYVIDALLWMALLIPFFIGTMLGWVAIGLPAAVGGWLNQLLSCGMGLVFGLKDGMGGASPGKRLTGLEVVDRNTRLPISWQQAFRRNWWYAVPFAPLVMLVQMNAGPRLGDKGANTMVIWKKHLNTRVFTPDAAICEKCNYDLRGNTSGVCPECGTPLSSYNMARVAKANVSEPAQTPHV